ncbi:hypothetical protein G210_4250 [Candida maltosa Xu316]|uniref:Uncharacterized protein n=1 Tax=Candida maltosa (strain Xu316) TaxID=1245528 RepID=M3IH14_CANMX|nr:hypothetical protein G210_4250 [Candida maltosa Xu316]
MYRKITLKKFVRYSHTFPLRVYQQDAINKVLESSARGVKRQAVQMATGGGKTVVFSHLLPKITTRGKKALVLGHKQELIFQSHEKISSINPHWNVGVEMAKNKAEPHHDVVVASVHSLMRRNRLQRFDPEEFDTIIIDECHHAVASSYRRILKYFEADHKDTKKHVIGFSATLTRLDEQKLGQVFDEIVYTRSLVDMIENKELSGFKVSETYLDGMDLSKVKKTKGDYDTTELYSQLSDLEINEKTLLSYMKLGDDYKSTMIFCVNIEHCRELCGLFQSKGINAQYVTGETNKTERSYIIEDFKNGKISVLCNVGVFTEGTDIPNIDSIILARPTRSRSLALQMIGRGLRLHKDKDHCHIIDLVNLTRFGLDLENTLDGKDTEEQDGNTRKYKDEKEEEDLEEDPDSIPSESLASIKENRQRVLDAVKDYHKMGVFKLKTRAGLELFEQMLQDTAFVQNFFFKSKQPWTELERNSTWGLAHSDDEYFLIRYRKNDNDEPEFRLSRHLISQGPNIELEFLMQSSNVLDVMDYLKLNYPKQIASTEKIVNFARRCTHKQAALILSFITRSVGRYCRIHELDRHEYENHILKTLLLGSVFSTDTSTPQEEHRHSNNWAVLVSTSRFWFNYRHMANALSLYRTVKRLGIPDSQIILMLSDDIACNPRNAFPGTVFNNMDEAIDLYGDSIEVDYRGYEVTVENFMRLLTDRWDSEQARSKRLLTDENSNIFIYLTGHGGNEFLKFQDAEEITAHDLGDAFSIMHEQKRYNEIFFMIDTCQANTMYEKITAPNILAVGSSELDESSYSHHSDMDIGVAVIDRFTYYTLDYLEKIDRNSKETMDKLFAEYTFENVHSHPGIRTDLFKRNVSEVLLTDFFGNVQNVVVDDVDTELLSRVSEEDNNNNNLNESSTQEAKERGAIEFSFECDENSKALIPLTQFTSRIYGILAVIIFVLLWIITPKI